MLVSLKCKYWSHKCWYLRLLAGWGTDQQRFVHTWIAYNCVNLFVIVYLYLTGLISMTSKSEQLQIYPIEPCIQLPVF